MTPLPGQAVLDRRAYNRLFRGESIPCKCCTLQQFYFCQETGHACKVFNRWVAEGGE